MSILLAFFLATFFSSMGVLPPGMLNMRVAAISIKKSIRKAKEFILGVSIIVTLQSFLGFYFATFFQNHPQLTKNLKLVGIIIFIALTIFFLGKGVQNVIQTSKLEASETKSKISPFYQGITLSILNVFPIPYYAFLSLYFSAFIPNFFTPIIGIAYVFGAVLGSALVYILYAFLFKKWESKISFFVKNVNFIIATVTGIIALFTLYKW
ncbi:MULTISPECIES: LysE family transporter [Flavobacterium]|uniref:Lysine transporter LysE n=2 Tax=Flavobacterium TaxID=237 RepID=A0AA94F604_9FLAO|nr:MULTISPECIES: LysE family transporter [Flavobacterium]OXA82666.1 hypothetical protein B0A56_04835 [Flavobacterium columnare NBRC 100251 = ATCC 23463]AMA48052.1 hypothetical protein AWN65_00545 [Flavobacterium covae]AND63804.1 hypothetical protein AX766_04920 [Flavobacterium covae]MCH4829953.1 LysE family transporter [Flavobacterium columnare]MCH4832667.1 LysE family transporter [Flavobacterium columnare]